MEPKVRFRVRYTGHDPKNNENNYAVANEFTNVPPIQFAKLIAAAPTLLKALEKLCRAGDEPHAEGCPMTWDGAECDCWIVDAHNQARAAIEAAK
jgi:hypothetical protein